jgi:hypothetical protein
LRLQGGSETRIVVEQPIHIFERRLAHLAVRQACQATQTILRKIVWQRRADIGDHRAAECRQLIDIAYAHIGPQLSPVLVLDFLDRRGCAIAPAQSQRSIRLRLDVYQTCVECRVGDEIG